MEDALALFSEMYKLHHSIEICIAELKRKGFTQVDTIKVLMEVISVNVVQADEIVHNSVAWTN